jgi:hypothetical protein
MKYPLHTFQVEVFVITPKFSWKNTCEIDCGGCHKVKKLILSISIL